MALSPPGAGAAKEVHLIERALFDFLVNLEVHKAARLQYPISVLCLGADLPETKAAQVWKDALAQLTVHELRATDVAASLDPSVAAVLLIGAETQDLPGIVARLSSSVQAPERESGTSRMTVSAGGGCYPQTATSGKELLQQAVDLMTRAQTDGGDRAYLPS
jgi:hypothetical protein